MEHVRAPGYKTEFVTGAMVAGPFADGLYRLTFFRDALPLLSEQLEVVENDGVKTTVKAVADQQPAPLVREDVVTIIVTPEAIAGMGSILTQHAAKQQASA